MNECDVRLHAVAGLARGRAVTDHDIRVRAPPSRVCRCGRWDSHNDTRFVESCQRLLLECPKLPLVLDIPIHGYRKLANPPNRPCCPAWPADPFGASRPGPPGPRRGGARDPEGTVPRRHRGSNDRRPQAPSRHCLRAIQGKAYSNISASENRLTGRDPARGGSCGSPGPSRGTRLPR